MSGNLPHVLRVYQGSDGDATKALFEELGRVGVAGALAVNLFRACKNSERAKVYRGRRYRGAAYDRKQWAMDNLTHALAAFSGPTIAWGWGIDEKQPVHRHVLYVELPTGQVSFHTEHRGKGPDYGKPWDGVPNVSADRILRWCARLLDGTP